MKWIANIVKEDAATYVAELKMYNRKSKFIISDPQPSKHFSAIDLQVINMVGIYRIDPEELMTEPRADYNKVEER